MEHNKKLGIVISNYNGKEDTLKCLESLSSLSFKDFFVVLIDDFSSIEEKKVNSDIETYGLDLIIINNQKNMGFAGANNVGIKKALLYKPEYIMLLNNDTLLEEDSLEKLMAEVSDNTVVTPLIMLESDRKLIWAAGLEYQKQFMIYSNRLSNQNIEKVGDTTECCDGVSFCACVIPSGAFEKVGFMDESYYMYDEDVDYCMRLKAAGYGFRCIRDAVIYHKAGAAGVGQKYTGLYYGLRNECYIREKYLEHGKDYNNRLLSENNKRLLLKKIVGKTYIDEYWVVQALSDWKNGIKGKKDFSLLDVYDVYVCQTSYHLLITLIKALNSKRLTKLILCTGNTFDDEFIKRIKNSGIFQEVIDYRDLDLFDKELDYSASMLKRHDSLQRQLDSKVKWEHHDNYEYYLYNDVGIIGKWLNSHKIRYHLIEDAMDTYTMPAFKGLNYKESYLKKILRRRLGAGFYCFGESLYYKTIEVNSLDGLLLKSNKIVVVPKKTLFEKLNGKQKKKILDVYMSKESQKDFLDYMSNLPNKELSLLLTQPFSVDKIMSEKMHEKLYRDVVNDYVKNELVIKPHPRDTFDYKRVFKEAFVIKENIVPIEIFEFFENVNFKQAVTVCSTSIKGISICQEKESLGIDFLKPYFKADEGFEQTWQFAKDMIAEK